MLANDQETTARRSRREFIAAGAVACASAMLGERMTMAAEHALTNRTFTGAIDAHVHVWTPDVERYPLATGFKRENMQPPSFTPEELLALARPCGVERVVLIQMSFYRYDNSYMLDTIRRFPGVFSGVAIVDDSAQRPQDEMRKLAKQGVRGFRIVSHGKPLDGWLNTPGMEAMWTCGAEDRLAMCTLTNPEFLPVIDRMCEKHPETPTVVDHFARIGVSGEIRSADLDVLCRLARHKQTYVKVSAFYALGKKQAPYTDLAPMIRRLVDAFGPERLMWASDCPFQVQNGHTYHESIELVRDHLDFLSDNDRQHILRKTAEKVYFS